MSVEIERRLRNLEAYIERLRKPDSGGVSTAFTPTLVGDGTAGTFTYDANNGGSYIRIGNRVFFTLRLRITAVSVAPTGNMRIGGLPFAGGTVTGSIPGGASADAVTGINLTAGYSWVGLSIVTGESSLRIQENGDNVAFALVQGAAIGLIGGVIEIRATGSYQV